MPITVSEDRSEITVTTGELKLVITRRPCRLSIFDRAGTLLNADEPSFGMAWDADDIRCFKTLRAGEKFFGLGEKTSPLDKAGLQTVLWNTTAFPDPRKLIADLRRDGFKCITIVDPGVKADESYQIAQEGLRRNAFALSPDGKPYKDEVWPSWACFPDFNNPVTRTWWGENLHRWLDFGLGGVWNDMNEPACRGGNFPDIVRFHDEGYGSDHKKIHNVYGHCMNRATREALDSFSPERRFILTRAGFAGTQRYAAMWTGDNSATEKHLQMACRQLQGMGLSGLPFVGVDAGGFSGTPLPDRTKYRFSKVALDQIVSTSDDRPVSRCSTPPRIPCCAGSSPVPSPRRSSSTRRGGSNPGRGRARDGESRPPLPVQRPDAGHRSPGPGCLSQPLPRPVPVGRDHG